MTQEDKELLMKDLCARLLHGTMINIVCEGIKYDKVLNCDDIKSYVQLPPDSTTIVKPYLRPMSSMTEKERKEYKHLVAFSGSPDGAANFVDWLNKKMFSYRTIDGKDMFELGIAITVTEDNNPYEA